MKRSGLKNGFVLQDSFFAALVELADTPDSKSGALKSVPVRPRGAAPPKLKITNQLTFLRMLSGNAPAEHGYNLLISQCQNMAS